jgi:hypothetical protein
MPSQRTSAAGDIDYSVRILVRIITVIGTTAGGRQLTM